MNRLRNWAVQRPFVFSVLFCVPVVLGILTVASVLAELLRHGAGWGSNGAYVGTTIGSVLGAAFLIELLRRFEWLDVVGFRQPDPAAWLFLVPPLLYAVTAAGLSSSGFEVVPW